MAILQANDFSSFSMTPEEELASRMIPITQIWNIQNQLAMAANKMLNIVIDPLNPLSAVQEQAALAGEIMVLRRLINESQEAHAQYNQGKKEFIATNNPNNAASIFPIIPKQE